MSAILFAVEFICVFFATLFILHYYGNLKKQHYLVSLVVFVSWYVSFVIVFILPIDVSNTSYLDCNTDFILRNDTALYARCGDPWSFFGGNTLAILWRIIYWTTQLLSWVLLPMMQSYVYAGEFTICGKIKTALYENALWYGSYLVIFGALLIYVALKPELTLDMNNLKLIGITASNTWGLLLLVLLLGYGLVELPRSAWHMSLPSLRLDQLYFKIAKVSTEKEDAEEALSYVLSEVKKASEEIKYNSTLRKHLDVIISKCPEGSSALFSLGTDDYVDYVGVKKTFDQKKLVKLHKKIMVETQKSHRLAVQWNSALKLAFFLEDVEKSQSNSNHMFKPSFSQHVQINQTKMRLQWFWENIIKIWGFKIFSVLLLILSVALVWSETTFFSTDPVLSIFAVLKNLAAEQYLYFQMEFISFVTILYMCVCTYYTVFKVKVFNFYYFEPHETDANSLLFSSLLLCRLTCSLSLNFLAMIHMDGHITGSTTHSSETQFTKLMGHMDLISFVAKGFNVYYPMIVVLVCFCTYLNLGKRLLHCIGLQQFLSEDDFSSDYVREGKEIARREKRKVERLINSNECTSRRHVINEKYAHQRENASEKVRIDALSGDEDYTTSPSKSNFTNENLSKYSRYRSVKDDKIQLLSDIDYVPHENNGYQNDNFGNQKVPRNIFDDA